MVSYLASTLRKLLVHTGTPLVNSDPFPLTRTKPEIFHCETIEKDTHLQFVLISYRPVYIYGVLMLRCVVEVCFIAIETILWIFCPGTI